MKQRIRLDFQVQVTQELHGVEQEKSKRKKGKRAHNGVKKRGRGERRFEHVQNKAEVKETGT